jgi:hypothetical protein
MNDPVMPPSPEAPRHVGHETTDASPFYVGLFVLGLILMIALVLPFLSWLFGRFGAAAARNDPAQSALAADQMPPEPRLEVDPASALARWREEENRQLSNYGWIDAQRGVVRIPVGRAIEILAERGLPEPEGPVELPAKGQERTP